MVITIARINTTIECNEAKDINTAIITHSDEQPQKYCLCPIRYHIKVKDRTDTGTPNTCIEIFDYNAIKYPAYASTPPFQL